MLVPPTPILLAIVNDACMQKIKIGHRANFRAKYKCFPQILFPVRAILRSINFRCTDFNTDLAFSYGVCTLRARVHLKTLSTGSPHIRLEQTNFIGRVLCRLLRTRNAQSVSARSGAEITKSLGACSEI